MNKRLLSIIIATVMALLAVVMVNTYISRLRNEYHRQEVMVDVVVAAQDIPKGTTIVPSLLKIQPWPQKYVQPKALTNPREAYGKIALGDFIQGEQVMYTKLTLPNKTPDSLAVRLPQGKRAFSVRFPDAPVTSVGGKIRPGDHVDIIGIFPLKQKISDKEITQEVSVSLFQNVLVMEIIGESNGNVIFTFALTPEESGILNYAKQHGRLQMILRHPLDTDQKPVPPVEENVMWQYIFNALGQQFIQPQQQQQQQSQPKPDEPPASPTLEIYRGSKRGEIEIK